MARGSRWRYLKDCKVLENVYKRKEIVAEPSNLGGKDRTRLDKALYESQSGKPSVPDEMLYAITRNASWLSPGPQSAHFIPPAFRLLLHCVEGLDSPNWRVVNDVWRSTFLVEGLVVERISTSTFHRILTASHCGSWAWQFQEEVFDVVTFLTPRCSADRAPRCVSFEDFRYWEIVPRRPKGLLHKYQVKASLRRPCIWCAATLRERFPGCCS